MNSLQAAVILAGGGGRRLGGSDKPALRVDGRSLLHIALDAVQGCPVVVVGPPRQLPAGIISAREDPAGGGPAAGVAAGIGALPPLPAGSVIAVLAADLPGISSQTVARLINALFGADRSGAGNGSANGGDDWGGAVLIDAEGRRQYLIGVWQLDRLVAAIGTRSDWDGARLRDLLEPIPVVEIMGIERETADVDTPADWRQWQS